LSATTPDWVCIDHRPVIKIEAGDLPQSIRTAWDLTPDLRIHIEAGHRLTHLGAGVTHATYAASHHRFDAQWRRNALYTVEGDLITHGELFDEAALDAALARFDEMDRPATMLENAATRAWARVVDAMNRQDVDGFLANAASGAHYEDRRKVLRHEDLP